MVKRSFKLSKNIGKMHKNEELQWFKLNKNSPSQNILSGSWDGRIAIWNTQTFECLKSFDAHFHYIEHLFFVTNELLLSRGEDNVIKIWNIKTNENVKTIDDTKFYIQSLLLLPETNELAFFYF